MIKSDIECKWRPHKIIIKMQIGLEISLFSQSILNVLL